MGQTRNLQRLGRVKTLPYNALTVGSQIVGGGALDAPAVPRSDPKPISGEHANVPKSVILSEVKRSRRIFALALPLNSGVGAKILRLALLAQDDRFGGRFLSMVIDTGSVGS